MFAHCADTTLSRLLSASSSLETFFLSFSFFGCFCLKKIHFFFFFLFFSVRSVRSFGSGGASASSAELEWDEDVRNATDVWDAQYHMKAQILMTEV